MKPRLKSTPAARELIKAHESFLGSARQQSDGSWIIGYGHRAAAKAGVNVSADEAELLLVYDVLRAEQAIDESLGGDMGAPQRDALVSFAHGIGLTAFRNSAVVRLIRKKRWLDAADAIAAWEGGASARHKAERDLFLKDLPEEASRAPVELVIEFDHPDDDNDKAVPAAKAEPGLTPDAPETAEKAVDDASAEEDTAEDPPVAENASSAPAEPVLRDATPRRSELAERVILRMRAQLSGPIRDVGYAEPGPETEAPPEEKVEFTGPLGFAYTQSHDFDRSAGEATPTSNTAEAPPIVGAAKVNADGAAGEVAGSREAADPEDSEADEADDLPDPSEIDADFTEDETGETTNGWTNGDARPAPGKNGGHLGEIILLVLGLILLAGGIWDLWMRVGSGEEQPSLFYGVAALVVGFIFAAGAAIWLLGGRRK
jgi:GH24 family phage-related lysozyme (muramidase)